MEQESVGSFRGPEVRPGGPGSLKLQKAVVEAEGAGTQTGRMKQMEMEDLEVQSLEGPLQVWLSSRRVHQPFRLGAPSLSGIPRCSGTLGQTKT